MDLPRIVEIAPLEL